jgi:hypothetical protein
MPAFSSREIYISVDIEASGPIPGEYSMLSIGACVVGDIARSFYAELKPLNDNFTQEAMDACKLSLQDLARTGRAPAEAMRAFGEWVHATADGMRPVFVGFNAPFDWSFVNYYFHKFTGANPFGHAALDIKSYYMGAYRTAWSETSMAQLPPEVRPHPGPLQHEALADAVEQSEIFRKLLVAGGLHVA